MNLEQAENSIALLGIQGPVLVVEDDPGDARLLLQLLNDAGVATDGVRHVATLGEARATLTELSPAAVLVDLTLPDADGLEAVTVLASALPDAPIVVITAQCADAMVYAALAEGAQESLHKDGLDAERLCHAIRRAVERHRAMRRLNGRRHPAVDVLESVDAPSAALDGTGRIVAVNRAWRDAAVVGGGSARTTGVGVNYLTVCRSAAGAHAEGAAEVALGIRSVLAGWTQRFSMDYPCPANGMERWFTVRVTPLGELGGGAVVTHLEITDVKSAEMQIRSGSTKFATMLADASIFALLDADGRVLHVAEETERLLGLRATELIGTIGSERVDAADVERVQAALTRVLASPESQEAIGLRYLDGERRWRDLDLVMINQLFDPTVSAVVVAGADTSAARRDQVARRIESRLLYRLPTAVTVTDERGVVTYWNARAEQMYGYRSEHVIGRSITDLSVGPTAAAVADEIATSLAETGSWEGDYDVRTADGSLLPVYTVLERVDEDDIDFRGLVGASIDISDRRRLEEELAYQALRDPLTGLPNRRLFVEHLDRVMDRLERTQKTAAVLFVDLDDFKSVNDMVGHVDGDRVLRAAATSMAEVVREQDVIARLGGDEFVVCCDDLDGAAEALMIAERIARALRTSSAGAFPSPSVTASIGVALATSARSGEAVLRNADAAMYEAKLKGKGRIVLFDEASHAEASRRHRLLGEFVRAMEAGEIVAMFQPEIDLGSGRTVGFEALVRWDHPERGLLLPGSFMPAVEGSDHAASLFALMLDRACAFLRQWNERRAEQPIWVSVNLSARELAVPLLPEMIRQCAQRYDVPLPSLCFEVTETSIMEPVAAEQALRRIRDLGATIAIDDFGTGYSSLSRLKRFPVDFLKIDRSFVVDIGCDPQIEFIASAVIAIADVLGARVIAEGVEELDQAERLVALGCRLGQGFLWSRAVTAAEAIDLAEFQVGGGRPQLLPRPSASPDCAARATNPLLPLP